MTGYGYYPGGYMPQNPAYAPGYGQQPMRTQMQPLQNFPAAEEPSASPMIWVLGEAGAKAYLVAPRATVVLWDRENPVIYIKSADENGMPSMKVLEWRERESQAAAPASDTADRIGKLEEQVNGLAEAVAEIRKERGAAS